VRDKRGKIERANWGPPWKPFDVEGYRNGGGMVKRWKFWEILNSEDPKFDKETPFVLAADYDALEAKALAYQEAHNRSMRYPGLLEQAQERVATLEAALHEIERAKVNCSHPPGEYREGIILALDHCARIANTALSDAALAPESPKGTI